MNTLHYRWSFTLVLAGLVLAACSAQPLSPDPASASDPGPRELVESFYGWYLDYSAADPETGEFKNPLVDGAYKERPELAPEMVSQVEAALAQPVADPFLCAQDVPTDISVVKEEVADEVALITVESSFEGHSFKVELVKSEAGWQISEVMCAR